MNFNWSYLKASGPQEDIKDMFFENVELIWYFLFQDKVAILTKCFSIASRTKVIQVCSVQICNDCAHGKIAKTGEFVIIPSNHIKNPVHVIHDCKGGLCRLSETSIYKKVEQENAEIKQKHLEHNKNHNMFFVNKYYI